MDTAMIIAVVSSVFSAADAKDQKMIARAFAERSLIDYTSISGGTPIQCSPHQVTRMWKKLFGGFDRTDHRISNLKIATGNDEAFAYLKCLTDHFNSGSQWTVEGSYEVKLTKAQNNWKITAFKFIFQKQSGDKQMRQRI